MTDVTATNFRAHYNKTDDRKNKDYHARLTVGCDVTGVRWGDNELRTEIMEAVRSHMPGRHDAGSDHRGDGLYVYVTFKYPADKPSLIRSEGDLINHENPGIQSGLARAVEAGLQTYNRHVGLANRVRFANVCGRHAASVVAKQAKRAVRYDQRLAALKAELEAEARVIFTDDPPGFGFTEQHLESFHLDEEEATAATEAARKNLRAYLVADHWGVPQGFPGRREKNLTAEELGLKE